MKLIPRPVFCCPCCPCSLMSLLGFSAAQAPRLLEGRSCGADFRDTLSETGSWWSAGGTVIACMHRLTNEVVTVILRS